MNVPVEFSQWLDLLESLLNFKRDRLLKMAFHVLDFNDDGAVCMLDLYSIMKLYENDEDVFIKGYAHDFCQVVAAIHKKMIAKGKEDYEIQQRLKNIERKVKKLTQRPASASSHGSRSSVHIVSESRPSSGTELAKETRGGKRSALSKRSLKESTSRQRLGSARSARSRVSRTSYGSVQSGSNLGSVKRQMSLLLEHY